MLSKLQRGECNDFWKEIKTLNPKKGPQPLTVGGTSGDSNIANYGKIISIGQPKSIGPSDNRNQVMNALRTAGSYDVTGEGG